MSNPFRKQADELKEVQLEDLQSKYQKLIDKYKQYKERYHMNGDQQVGVVAITLAALVLLVFIGTCGYESINEDNLAHQRIINTQKCMSTCTSEIDICKQKCVPEPTLIECMNKCEVEFDNDHSEANCNQLCFKHLSPTKVENNENH